MRKENIILGYFNYSIKKLLMYRVYLLSELVGSLLLPIIINFFLWKSLLASNTIEYNLKEMMIYIIISNLILLFTQVYAEHELEHDIKSHRLGQKLLLPMNYLKGMIYRHISSSLATFLLIYLPLIITSLFFLNIPIPITNLTYFAITLVIGLCLNLLFSFIIGLLSFWLTEIWGVAAIRSLLTGLLAGSIFPLDILPSNIVKIMLMSPFPYMAYVPSKIVTDPSFSMGIMDVLQVAIFWLVVLLVITYLLMARGLKKYTSNGV